MAPRRDRTAGAPPGLSGALGLAAALVLGACATGGPLPQPAEAPAAQVTVTGADGARLAAARWGPEDAATVILGLHGFGDHGQSTFRRAAQFWAGRGIATVAYDQRGFGRNPSRGVWPGAGALIGDVGPAIAGLRTAQPCRRIVLLGHSMGGGVALAAAGEGGIRPDGLILAAPAIWGGETLNPLHRLLAWVAAGISPDTRFSGRGFVQLQASDNIAALRALGRDPLYLSPPSAREIMGLVRLNDRAEAVADRARGPALLLLGARDEIVPNETVAGIFARLPGPRTSILYPEGWHLLFRDLQAERAWRDVADWIDALPPPDRCG